VYRSGQGAKGRGQLEKTLLSKVLHIFLGDCLPADNNLNGHRKLQPGTIASLEDHLTTKLDQTKLDKETHIKQEHDAVGCLFIGVHHIYNRINVAKNCEKDIGASNEPNNIKDIINEAMEYKPSEDIIPNMNEHSFSGDLDEDKGNEHNDDLPFQTESKLCIMDLSKCGWEDINKVNVKEVRKTAKERHDRQRDITKYITMKVIGMKKNSGSISICEENVNLEDTVWAIFVSQLRPNYHR
jgi:hypothetical protein